MLLGQRAEFDFVLGEAVRRADVPVSFLLGRSDRHAGAKPAAAYLEALHAPSKKLIWFERSAHNVPFEEPERCDATLRDLVKSIPSGGENPEADR